MKTRDLILSAICLALCMVLPFLTGQIPEIGNMLCPMHLPVLLCGFVVGPILGAAVGLMAPLLRFALFGMPPPFPTGIAMCFELAVYAFTAGYLYRKLPRKRSSLYLSLLTAMLSGRVVWGIVRAILSGAGQSAFTWGIFFSEAFLTAIPGIILQILLIPLLVVALEKAKFMKKQV